jgi:hypothetical protein
MGKYDKYFMTEVNLPPSKQETASKNAGIYSHVAWLDSNRIKGAFYTECVWYYRPRKSIVGTHTHDFDEIIAFFGSNPDNIHGGCLKSEGWDYPVWFWKGFQNRGIIINR